jgi:3-phosphoshikimate 1-carboxyvinyltransferase
MRITVNRSELSGKVRIPGSKSQTIRGLMCAALAGGESVLENPLICDDTAAAVDVLGRVGIDVLRKEDLWRITGGKFWAPDADLYCGESAATLRFMTAICSVIPGKCRLTGGPSLSRRPMGALVEALKRLGVSCSTENGDMPPVNVAGGTLRGGLTELPGHISSQFVSALLLAAPLAQEEVTIRLTSRLTSRPYLLMTLECLETFGIKVNASSDIYRIPRQNYRPARFAVEGDWSSASYFLALGALSGGIEVENVSPDSVQGDKVILDFLQEMGAKVEVSGNTVAVSQGKLKAIKADLTDCIDLLPTMAVLAALAEGTSEFSGISMARIKESNRVAAVREGLERTGVAVTEAGNRLTITGMMTGRPATIDSRNDHRIAMAFGVLGSAWGGITVTGAECVAKTYPGFWDALKSIGGKVEKNE